MKKMIFALLPVKSPQNAKQRLRGFLSPAQREELARAMFEQVLRTLCFASGVDRVAVVTSDQEVAGLARSHGVDVWLEYEQLSHSHSADAASQRAIESGASSVILLPIDVPLISRVEIESLVQEAKHGIVVVPSADGTGTNALVRSPPNAIKACFGPGSFLAHCAQAESVGLPLKILRPPGILFDIDTAEDVAELLARAPGSPISCLLQAQIEANATDCGIALPNRLPGGS